MDIALHDSSLLRHLRKDILLDTGPLLLLLVGRYDPFLLPTFKRLRGRTQEEFVKLESFLSKFRKVVVTPHVLAELSNLARSLGEQRFRFFLERCIIDLQKFHEIYITKNDILQRAEFTRFGVTDTGIILACEQHYDDCVVLVQEEKLRRVCDERGLYVINFWGIITA